jgi:predicted phosphate transport protein (TIGR00153 family)
MLFGGKKERLTEDLIKRHIEAVGDVIQSLHQAIKDYCTDCSEFETRAREVEKFESAADDLRREIEHQLYDGAFMPVQRGDYSRMVEAVDKIANQSEAVSQFLLLTRPELDEATIEGLGEIMDATTLCYKSIPQMFEQFDRGEVVNRLAHEIEDGESKVDELFARIVRDLFASDLDLARKLHIKLLLDRAAAVSNRIEDASDCFQILVSKRP